MGALIPDKGKTELATELFFYPIKMQQAISGTSAATLYVDEAPHLKFSFSRTTFVVCAGGVERQQLINESKFS